MSYGCRELERCKFRFRRIRTSIKEVLKATRMEYGRIEKPLTDRLQKQAYIQLNNP